MQIKGLVWAGTRTMNFDGMLAFCRDVLGMKQGHIETEFAALTMPNGDRFEIFGAGCPYNTFMTHPVVGFLVDDLPSARAEFEQRGVEFIEPIQKLKNGNAWCHFRAPDGFLYSLNYFPPRRNSST
jgi:catechol 2,3-dioxygenase-like lactoylglutathione lyase family enzyme